MSHTARGILVNSLTTMHGDRWSLDVKVINAESLHCTPMSSTMLYVNYNFKIKIKQSKNHCACCPLYLLSTSTEVLAKNSGTQTSAWLYPFPTTTWTHCLIGVTGSERGHVCGPAWHKPDLVILSSHNSKPLATMSFQNQGSDSHRSQKTQK